MKTNELVKDIFLLSKNAENMLFEGMWEMPNGVSLNSYIVKGDETAIIDGFCGWDGYPESLFKLLDRINVDLKSIKHVVINHMEPDHTGWLSDFKKIHTDFNIYCTKEAASILEMFYGKFENVNIVKTGDNLDLGNSKKLEFIKTPNVHWPDTMMTYEKSSKTLFSCDCFGSFGKVDKLTCSEYTLEEIEEREDDRIRYYSNVMGLFSTNLLRAINQLKEIDIDIIAPGHGIIWKEKKDFIIDWYEKHANYQRSSNKDNVLIIYGSMYGTSTSVIPFIEEKIKEKGLNVKSLDAKFTDPGTILLEAWRSKRLIFVAPTYEFNLFPPVAFALDEIGRKKLQNRDVLYLGSSAWSGGAFKEFNSIIEKYRLKWNIVEGIEFRGSATDEILEKIENSINNLIDEK